MYRERELNALIEALCGLAKEAAVAEKRQLLPLETVLQGVFAIPE
jgi:hypothetical protein